MKGYSGDNLLLFNRPHKSILSSKPNDLQKETETIERKYAKCYRNTLKLLDKELNRRCCGIFPPRCSIEYVAESLITSASYRKYKEITNERGQLIKYIEEDSNQSWFNFKPLYELAKDNLFKHHPNLKEQWEEYRRSYKEYCYKREVKNCQGTIFHHNYENVFIIQMDDRYNEMKLCDIRSFHESICFALETEYHFVHFVAVGKGSLLLLFNYCSDDYIKKFQLTKRQLQQLADIKPYKILSLKDAQSRFAYHRIQAYKVL